MSTKVQTNVPPPTAAEEALTQRQVELAEFQLDELRRQRASQEAFAADLEPLLVRQQAEIDRQAQRQQQLEPLQDELLTRAVEDLRRGGRATPEQERLIDDAGRAALEQGQVDIERFRTESLDALRNELAPALGLRPGDTPVLDRGARVAAEATRQGGQLASRIAESTANARLNFPLASSQLQSAQNLGLQQVTEATRQFNDQLRQAALQNRISAGQSLGQLGLGLAGNPAGTLASAQAPLTQARLAGTTKTQSGLGIGGIAAGIGGVGGLLQGVGALSAFSSRTLKEEKEPVDEDTVLAAIEDMPVERWRYKPGLGLGEERHIGPYAEDMRDRLGIGDGTKIPIVDAIGVGLAGTKALARRVERVERGLGLRG